MSGPKTAKRIVLERDLPNREALKKTFLPLLTDIFELRQMIDTHKLRKSFLCTKRVHSPEEVLKKLEMMRLEMEESRIWCEGVISQISKGIGEAKEVLEPIKKRPLWKKLLLR